MNIKPYPCLSLSKSQYQRWFEELAIGESALVQTFIAPGIVGWPIESWQFELGKVEQDSFASNRRVLECSGQTYPLRGDGLISHWNSHSPWVNPRGAIASRIVPVPRSVTKDFASFTPIYEPCWKWRHCYWISASLRSLPVWEKLPNSYLRDVDNGVLLTVFTETGDQPEVDARAKHCYSQCQAEFFAC